MIRSTPTSAPTASSYLRRGADRPGMIVDGGPVVDAFARIGWEWGGY